MIHLHTHTHYSLLDGLAKIDDLIAKAREFNMPGIAITDHGVMYGAIEFYEKCKKAGIKPIIGFETYLAINKLTNKQPNIDNKRYHLTLLAKNEQGYKNLMALSSIGQVEGFYYKPRIDKEVLKKHRQGIICLSGCLKGEITQKLLHSGQEEAQKTLNEYLEIFGKENFYLEVQSHPKLPESEKAKKLLIEFSKKTNIPLVATNDSHYISPEDQEAHEVLLCVQTNKRIDDAKRLSMAEGSCHFKSPQEMKEEFKEIPDALERSLEIMEKCNLELELGKWVFPKFEIPNNLSADEYLKQQAYLRIMTKIRNPKSEIRNKSKIQNSNIQNNTTIIKQFNNLTIPNNIKKRLDYELNIIAKKGYSSYFLVVADFANWARSKNIISTTRGSAAGSIVSYALGITTINPLDYNLPFERFLNPYRPSPPDIDMDFEDTRRDEVLNYVREKYGQDKVAQIGTFGTMKARAAVRDVGRALNIHYGFCDKLAKIIPTGKQGFHLTLIKALEISPEFKQMYDTNPDAKRIINLAQKLEGCARHASVHAAGVVISPERLTHYTPLQRDNKENKIITQYDMHCVEKAGLLKMDFLGIRNLSILGLAQKIISKTQNIKLDLDNLSLNDTKTYNLLSLGETRGIFQLSGDAMTHYIKQLKPTNIFDIMAMVALYRPGPMDSIPEFIQRKNNPEQISYLDPCLKNILQRSYGVITYQDDVLLIAIELAGYSWEEADKLRKAMGKKIPQEMAAQKAKFISGCVQKGKLEEAKAAQLWKLIEPFAAYGFNLSHAASYAVVAYQTAYVKAHFPAEFMAAYMTCESENAEKISQAITECERLGIQVLPPDINESYGTFAVVSQTAKQPDSLTALQPSNILLTENKTANNKKPIIRFGLNAIKNLGHNIVKIIVEERKANGNYKDLTDIFSRVTDKDLNKKSLEALIKAGALDRFQQRELLLHNLDNLLSFSKKLKKEKESGQDSLFGQMPEQSSFAVKLEPLTEQIDKNKRLAWEKELLGIYLSEHPLDKFREYLKNKKFTQIDQLIKTTNYQSSNTLQIAGIINSVKKILTRKNEPMLFARTEDLTGEIECLVFPRVLEKNPNFWQEDKIIEISGTMSYRNDEKKIIVDKAKALQPDSLAAKQPYSQTALQTQTTNYQILQISIPKNTNKKTLQELKQLLLKHKQSKKNSEQTSAQIKLILSAQKTLNLNLIIKLTGGLIQKINLLLRQKACDIINAKIKV